MPRTSKPPAYRLHKPSGKAVVTIAGRDHYLGTYGTAKSKEAYAALLVAVSPAPAPSAVVPNESAQLPLSRLLLEYWQHAQGYYVGSELQHRRYLVKRLRTFAGDLLVAEFGPKRLRAFRQTLIEEKLSRTYINHCINRVRSIFKWGIGQELVRADTLEMLKAVEPLLYGKTEAKGESEPVKAVPTAWVDAVLPYCSRQVKAMIELQRLTGMRSGELVIMRTCDINTAGKVWAYTPESHKTKYRGHSRIIFLGPQAQAVLRPWLRTALKEYLFSPAEAEGERRATLATKRKTPLSCGNKAGTNKRRKPAKAPGERYDTRSYHQSLGYALTRCNAARREADPEAADIHWHPHQLRHLAATTLRREYGLEVARVVLGHKNAKITEVYAEADHERACEAMGKIG